MDFFTISFVLFIIMPLGILLWSLVLDKTKIKEVTGWLVKEKKCSKSSF